VLETIKGGQTVYRRAAATTAEAGGFDGSCAASPRCFTGMRTLAAWWVADAPAF
jgi:hypothetical protein